MRIRMSALTVMFFLALSFAGTTPANSANGITELAASPSLIQCMTDCIKYEGNTATAKSTCKLRCANVPMPGAQRGGKDCMAVYKNCNRTCPKGDKSCRKACKANLMQCK